MARYNYEFGTTPRKLEPKYNPNKKSKKELEEQIKRNEAQRKYAMQLEKKKHNQNVALIVTIFLILLGISYRSSLINEKFSEVQKAKNELASIEKTNGQLEVSIESSLNLSNIEEAAKEKLGMQKLDNNQKVYVTLDKKDYVEVASDNVELEDSQSWYQKIMNKIFGK